MAKLLIMHPSDDQLDLYMLGHLPPARERRLVEHYRECPQCLDRLAALADFIVLLKAARAKCPALLSYRTSPIHSAAARKSIFRIAAMLLVGFGSALICNAPALIRSTPPAHAALQFETPPIPELPKSSQKQHRTSAARKQARALHPRPNRAFRPPPQRPPVALETATLELPDDLTMEPRLDAMAELLEPPHADPPLARRHWFRRMLGAVRRAFAPPE